MIDYHIVIYVKIIFFYFKFAIQINLFFKLLIQSQKSYLQNNTCN